MTTRNGSENQAAQAGDVLRWVEESLAVARRKKTALIDNDLVALDACIEAERTLLYQRPEAAAAVREGRTRDKVTSPMAASTPDPIADLAAELRLVNQQNAILIEFGLSLSRVMLDVIYPPATYDRTGSTDLSGSAAVTETILSVEG